MGTSFLLMDWRVISGSFSLAPLVFFFLLIVKFVHVLMYQLSASSNRQQSYYLVSLPITPTKHVCITNVICYQRMLEDGLKGKKIFFS
jgi:hypothetical protein